jgi:hypothetical protein
MPLREREKAEEEFVDFIEHAINALNEGAAP